MTVTYDATHHETLQVSPMTRLICHLCRELTHAEPGDDSADELHVTAGEIMAVTQHRIAAAEVIDVPAGAGASAWVLK